MAGHRPVLDLGRPLADQDHVGQLTTADPVERSTPRPAGAQAARQLGPQATSTLHEERLVDRLVGHPHLRLVGVILPQLPGDLLGRPAGLEEALDDPAQRSAAGQLGAPRATGAGECPGLGQVGPVAAPAAVAGHLSRDRRRRPTHCPRDTPERFATAQAAADLLALGD